VTDWTHLHPILIHFPIALITIGVLFELIGRLRAHETWRTVGKWNLYAGTIALGLAVASGLLAASIVSHSEEAHEIMERHEQVGITLLILFSGLGAWRLLAERGGGAFGRSGIFLALLIAGNLLLGYGAYLGGRLVYEHGLAVARPAMGADHHAGTGHHHGGASSPVHGGESDAGHAGESGHAHGGSAHAH